MNYSKNINYVSKVFESVYSMYILQYAHIVCYYNISHVILDYLCYNISIKVQARLKRLPRDIPK